MPRDETKLHDLADRFVTDRTTSPGRGPPWLATAGPLAKHHRFSPYPARNGRVDQSETTMSKLTRTLILAATVAAMNLASTTTLAHASTNDDPASKRHRVLGQLELIAEDAATAQQQLAESWDYYQQATRVPPAELQARMQADATQRKLADRWTYYYQTTRMSPAELQAWMQAKDRPDTSTEPPAQVPAPGAADRAERAASLARRLACGAGGGAGARRWTRPAGRQACQPQSPGRAGGRTPSQPNNRNAITTRAAARRPGSDLKEAIMRGRTVLFVILAVVLALGGVYVGWSTNSPKAAADAPATPPSSPGLPRGPARLGHARPGPPRRRVPRARAPRARAPRTRAPRTREPPSRASGPTRLRARNRSALPVR